MKQIQARKMVPLLVGFLLVAMAPGDPSGGDRGRSAFIDRTGMVGQMAPDFTLKDLNGKSVTLSAFRGKVVLLNFWATWCSPCKSEMPSFQRLFRDEYARGFEVIAISADKSAKDVRDYLSKNRFDFTIVMDEKTTVSKRYGVFSMPTTFLIDRNGIIIEKFLGEYEWTSPEIRKVLEKQF